MPDVAWEKYSILFCANTFECSHLLPNRCRPPLFYPEPEALRKGFLMGRIGGLQACGFYLAHHQLVTPPPPVELFRAELTIRREMVRALTIKSFNAPAQTRRCREPKHC